MVPSHVKEPLDPAVDARKQYEKSDEDGGQLDGNVVVWLAAARCVHGLRFDPRHRDGPSDKGAQRGTKRAEQRRLDRVQGLDGTMHVVLLEVAPLLRRI